MRSVRSSVVRLTSQSPVIPNTAGSAKIMTSRMTSPRAEEIIADSFASPIEVKYIDAMQLSPANGNDVMLISIPRAAATTIFSSDMNTLQYGVVANTISIIIASADSVVRSIVFFFMSDAVFLSPAPNTVPCSSRFSRALGNPPRIRGSARQAYQARARNRANTCIGRVSAAAVCDRFPSPHSVF